MESPRTIQDSKELRWTGRPSEEQLLHSLESPLRPATVTFEPPASRDWALTETATPEPSPATPGWRLQPRDLLALAAVAAAVWLAIRGSEGLPFHSNAPAAPASASEVFRATLSPDRGGSLASADSTTIREKSPGAKAGGGGGGHDHQKGEGDGGSRGSGGAHTTKPPADDTEPPLLEATVPGVGTVTVDPDLPDTSGVQLPDVQLPDLPDTSDIETPTVSLPTLP
jgi:hypothetical protein